MKKLFDRLRRRGNAVQMLADQPQFKKYDIGSWSYGAPEVIDWNDGSTLRVGKYCSIARGVTMLLGGEHHHKWVSTYPFGELFPCDGPVARQMKTKGDISIGNDVWIGRDAMILSGVTIHDGVVLGARSLVTQDLPAYTVCAGSPARPVLQRFSEDEIARLLEISWWDWPESRVREFVPMLLSGDVTAFIERCQSAGMD
jgi:acetyltransferase-like isoleucine patch superfamily enzyme